MATSTKIKTVPDGHRLVTTPDGTFYQKIKRSRKKYKTPKAARNKMSLAARRIRWPLLTMTAVGIPVITATTKAGGFNKIFTRTGSYIFGRELLSYYTGVFLSPVQAPKFQVEKLMMGLLPLLILGGVKRLGVFRGINQQLGRMRIPLRLS